LVKKLVSYDDTDTRKIPGVKNVVRWNNIVAVLASSTWNARKGRDALKLVWEDASPLESTADHDAAFKKLVQQKADAPGRNDGDVEKSLAGAKKTLESTYQVPILSHAPMEPINFFAMCATAKRSCMAPRRCPAK